jgi:hypothetical protein
VGAVTWPTYWLDPDGTVALGLRRYRHDWDQGAAARWECEFGWHQAVAWRGEFAPQRWDTDPRGCQVTAAALPVDHADPRWPQVCAGGCGYRFAPADEWQEWEEPVYTSPGGARFVLHTGWPPPPGVTVAGPGACWDAWWLPDGWKGPDGIGLTVRCPRPDGTPGPPHDWQVDAPATGGGRWTRTGDPHRGDLTVTPSIAAGVPGRPGYYHSHLQAGVLGDHLGG